MLHIWYFFGLLVVLYKFEVCNALNPSCDYYLALEPGQIYQIANPNYPNSYVPGIHCRWYVKSLTRVRITCNDLSIAKSPQCSIDTLNVYTNRSIGPRRYCGNGNFNLESLSQEMIIEFKSDETSPGGSFKCDLQAVENNRESCRCGWKNPTKIVGGRETGVHEYPMMAAIIKADIQQVYCGATIISEKYVISAAHCIVQLEPENTGVLVGDHNLFTGLETSATKLYKVSHFVIHPDYVQNKKDYDIAVIGVTTTIVFTNLVGPVCLPFQHYFDSFGGSPVDILGWGSVEFGGALSGTLQNAKVSVTNYLDCKDVYPDLEYRKICTFAIDKDACQFDSGGPVLWQNPTSRRIVLVGIISHGTSCASNRPAVNTRVGAYIEWIVEVTQGTNYCKAE